jgi:hypothetical protein
MVEKKFKLEFGIVIPSKKVNRESEYGSLLEEFLNSGAKTAKVVWNEKKPSFATVAVSLRKTAKGKPVKVRGLEGVIYLERKEEGKGESTEKRSRNLRG